MKGREPVGGSVKGCESIGGSTKGREPIGESTKGHEPLFLFMYMYCVIWYFGQLAKLCAYPVHYKCFQVPLLFVRRVRLECTRAHWNHVFCIM